MTTAYEFPGSFRPPSFGATEVLTVPYTREQAWEIAKAIGGTLGLREDQLPTSVFVDILNGLEECQRILRAVETREEPTVPAVGFVATGVEP